MIEENKLNKFHENFSLITVSANKVPNFPWKSAQSEKPKWTEFIKNYNYKGGIFKKDGDEIPATDNFGIVTGFDFLECVDVDLKVFSTAVEQKEFWEEYIEHLRDNIFDFDEKIVIYKTKNAGYHLLYKTKRVEGNLKLAKLKGHKEAVIETRGIGGYIFTYPENKVGKKSYFDIDFISDQDREIIMSFSRMYNHIDELPQEPVKKKTEYQEGETTPWQDYNEKTDILELIADEFSIPRGGVKSKFTMVKRFGGTSPHSGYVFKDSGCLFLFSTGTSYPHEKLITPFMAYAIKFHASDFSAAAKDLYSKGFGSRVQKIIHEKEKSLPKNSELIKEYNFDKSDLEFPIDIFPKPIQSYILECNAKLDGNVDFMGCSLLWLISVCVGNSIEVQSRVGWIGKANVWIAVVGRAGIGKTPSINNIIFPLKKINSREIKRYLKELDKFEFYDNLKEKEKADYPEVKKPKKKQFIANDITLEALMDLHQESDNSVGVFKDELAGWMKDMNKYRAGSDLESWLSNWNGEPLNINRMSRRGSFIEHPFIPVLGGIQPSIFNNFYTDENKDNGFMDRLLLSYPDAKVEKYNANEMDEDVLDWYKENIVLFFDTLRAKIKRDDEDEIIPLQAKLSKEAEQLWISIYDNYTDIQNNDDENEYLKSMYPKQKNYIPRFALLIHVFDEFFNDGIGGNTLLISEKSFQSAIRLSKYFIAMAKKVKITAVEAAVLKETSKTGKTTLDKVKAMYDENPDFNRSKAAEIIGISRRQLINIINQLKV